MPGYHFKLYKPSSLMTVFLNFSSEWSLPALLCSSYLECASPTASPTLPSKSLLYYFWLPPGLALVGTVQLTTHSDWSWARGGVESGS